MTQSIDIKDDQTANNSTNDNFVTGNSLWKDAVIRFYKNRLAMTCLIILGIITVACFIGPYFLEHPFDEVYWDYIQVPPNFEAGFYFGTDTNGRDLLVRVLHGGQISILIGVLAAFVAILIGVSYGATAGYFGGRVDMLMMRFVDILYAIPFIFFVILLMVFFGRNIYLMFIALGAVEWLTMARIVRGQTISIKNKEFVLAAKAIGVRDGKIIFKHIVPNIWGLIIIYATLLIPSVIMTESFLSYLGLGVQEPNTSWGALISEGANIMETSPWILIFPASFLAVTLFCFNFIGDGLRDALDPKQ